MLAASRAIAPSRTLCLAAVLSFAAAATAAAIPTTAAGDLTLSGTLVTPVQLDASTHHVLYYLQMHTGSLAEAFSVALTPPPFATAGGVDEGVSVDGPTVVALQGPGRLGRLVQAPSVIVACSARPAAFHGYATGPSSVDVMLPANSSSTLAVRYGVGRRAPWVDSDFRLKFTVHDRLVGHYAPGSPFARVRSTVPDGLSLTTTGPVVAGTTGAHILLTTAPGGTPGLPHPPRAIASRQAVQVGGRLLPAQSGRRVVLQWDRGGGALHTLASVTTGAGGVLPATTWRPGRAGVYELWASYPPQPGGLVADTTSCPLRFSVG